MGKRLFFEGIDATGKKIIVALFVIMLGLFAFAPAKSSASVIASGSCGMNAIWSLDDDGTMTISGSGDMDSYENYEDVPWYDFRESIKTLILEDGITAIGFNAFNGCNSIESLSIPVSARVGRQAFSDGYYNGGLKALKKIKLTGTGDMFDYSGESYVNNVYVEWNFYEDTPWYQANASGHNFEIEIGEGITSIGEYAFNNCNRVTKITIPKTIKKIGKYAFNECEYAVLSGLFIPDGMTSIEEYTFNNCTKITGEIIIPQSVTRIKEWAFNRCNGIESLSIPVTTQIAHEAFKNGYYNGGMESLTKVKITGKGDMLDYAGDAYVNNAYVEWNYYQETPWYQADSSGHNLEIEIAEGITSIGEYAFSDCYRVTKITIPKTIKKIGKYAFNNCECAVLSGLFIPDGMTVIGENTFYNCKKITGEVVIPSSVTTIENYAFNYCSGIESLSIPVSVKIADTAFGNGNWYGGMESLKKVKITGTGSMRNYTPVQVNNARVVWDSYEYTPWYQASLSGNNVTVELAEGITKISENAFYNCYRISEVTIPSSVKSIGNSAFAECSGIESINYFGTESAWSKIDIGKDNDILDTVSINYGNKKSDKSDDKTGNSKEVALSETKKTLSVGDKFTLTLENATGSTKWKSSNTKVITVKKGVVTAVGTGTATITATNNDNKYKCKVTVSGDVGLNYTTATIKVGETLKLKVSGANAVSFTSSKKSVAKVKASGAVVAKKAGTTTIKVKCDNGETYTCKVTVKK